jgi:hypothetical protein
MEPNITTMDDHRNAAPSPSAPSFVPQTKNLPPPVRELRRPPERSQAMILTIFIVVLLLFIVNVATVIIVTRQVELLSGEEKSANQSLQTAVANVSGQLDITNKRDQDIATASATFQQGLFDAGSALEAAGANLIRRGDELIAIGMPMSSDMGKDLVQRGTALKNEGVQYQELGARYKTNSKIGP